KAVWLSGMFVRFVWSYPFARRPCVCEPRKAKESVGARANGGHCQDRRTGQQFDEARGRAVSAPRTSWVIKGFRFESYHRFKNI
ncbi:hypothetical protein F4803DRAFT_541141, partial [Xylaria telfairii]